MGQYKTGKVNITDGSATVTGVDTAWLTADIQSGWIFKIRGEIGLYWIQTVVSNTQITLTQSYQNPDNTNIENGTYLIVQDYSPVYGWPLFETSDEDWEIILTRMIHELDRDLYNQHDKEWIYWDQNMTGGAWVESPDVSTATPRTIRYFKADPSVPTSPGRIYFDKTIGALIYHDGTFTSYRAQTDGSLVTIPNWRRVIMS